MILDIPLAKQTSEDSCRSICVSQIMNYYGKPVNLEDIENYCSESHRFRDWDYILGSYSLEKKFESTIHTRALGIFDSTWFSLRVPDLISKLNLKQEKLEQIAVSHPGFRKFAREAEEANKFLQNGGKIDFSIFTTELVDNYINLGIPVIATITGQLVYNLSKERDGKKDDIEGDPWKHSLIICGNNGKDYFVSDSSRILGSEKYLITKEALLEGVVRYDSNLLVIFPRTHKD